MKKNLVLLICCLLSIPSFSANDLFTYNAAKLSQEMRILDELESAVYNQHLISDPLETGTYKFNTDIGWWLRQPDEEVDKLLGIPPFYWGILLSGIGIGYVYKVTQDNVSTRQAFLGCVVNGVVLTGVYITRLLIIY